MGFEGIGPIPKSKQETSIGDMKDYIPGFEQESFSPFENSVLKVKKLVHQKMDDLETLDCELAIRDLLAEEKIQRNPMAFLEEYLG